MTLKLDHTVNALCLIIVCNNLMLRDTESYFIYVHCDLEYIA